MLYDYTSMFTLVVYLCIFSRIKLVSSSFTGKSECPVDLNYVLTIPWDSSACKNQPEAGHLDASSTCCQTLTSLYGVAFAKHLKQTSRFRLPDLSTSISCLSDFQNRLSFLSLPRNLTSICFQPQRFINTTNVCSNIQTKQDWMELLGPLTTLDSGCKRDLSDLSACDECVHAGFQVQAKLLAFDGNNSHSLGCFHYTILYAAGIVNALGPESVGALSCIFGLPMSWPPASNLPQSLILVFISIGAGFTAIVIVSLIAFFLWLKRKERTLVTFPSLDSELEENGLLHWRPKTDLFWFKYHDLEKATNNFSAKNLISTGQFGMVYKGKLPDRTMVAVKKILESDLQGDYEFCNEVELIGTLKHRNLVPLRGCCVSEKEGESQRFLVYDYMPNGNLHDNLFFSHKKKFKIRKRPLTWPQRKSIILDVANALAYLHYGVKPPIYHRDIKPTNILLDSEMRARVADFGLARQGKEGESHLTTRIAGTHGYLAPEYALYGQLTEKSDVYSFGIVLLEVMCGRRVLDLSSLENARVFFITDWGWSLVKAGRIEEALDPSLLENDGSVHRYTRVIMERFLLVGILCAHIMVAFRPTILDALKMLQGDIEVPVIPDRPIYAHENLLNSEQTPTRYLSEDEHVSLQ